MSADVATDPMDRSNPPTTSVHVTPSARMPVMTDTMKATGVTGWTVLPVLGGSGRSGEWSREGQVSVASEMSMVICLTTDDRADAVIEAALPLLSRGLGMISVSDVGVVRSEKF